MGVSEKLPLGGVGVTVTIETRFEGTPSRWVGVRRESPLLDGPRLTTLTVDTIEGVPYMEPTGDAPDSVLGRLVWYPIVSER